MVLIANLITGLKLYFLRYNLSKLRGKYQFFLATLDEIIFPSAATVWVTLELCMKNKTLVCSTRKAR
jgi:hypothetical protein